MGNNFIKWLDKKGICPAFLAPIPEPRIINKSIEFDIKDIVSKMNTDVSNKNITSINSSYIQFCVNDTGDRYRGSIKLYIETDDISDLYTPWRMNSILMDNALNLNLRTYNVFQKHCLRMFLSDDVFQRLTTDEIIQQYEEGDLSLIEPCIIDTIDNWNSGILDELGYRISYDEDCRESKERSDHLRENFDFIKKCFYRITDLDSVVSHNITLEETEVNHYPDNVYYEITLDIPNVSHLEASYVEDNGYRYSPQYSHGRSYKSQSDIIVNKELLEVFAGLEEIYRRLDYQIEDLFVKSYISDGKIRLIIE